jgi:hypothetical protein
MPFDWMRLLRDTASRNSRFRYNPDQIAYAVVDDILRKGQMAANIEQIHSSTESPEEKLAALQSLIARAASLRASSRATDAQRRAQSRPPVMSLTPNDDGPIDVRAGANFDPSGRMETESLQQNLIKELQKMADEARRVGKEASARNYETAIEFTKERLKGASWSDLAADFPEVKKTMRFKMLEMIKQALARLAGRSGFEDLEPGIRRRSGA